MFQWTDRNPHEPRNEHRQAAYEAGQKAMRDLMETTHSAGYHKDVVEGMVDAFMREHRTIQQETVKFFVQMLCLWVTHRPQSHLADGRNMATYEFAKKLAEEDPCFPFI